MQKIKYILFPLLIIIVIGCKNSDSKESSLQYNRPNNNNAKPIITLLGDNPMYLNQYDTFIDPGANAYDNEDGNITNKIKIISTVNTEKEGNYTIVYSITDTAGNKTQLTRKIIITKSQKPNPLNFKYNHITIAGSSISWGKGYLGEHSYVGEVEKYFREKIATTIIPDTLNTNVEIINDSMSYKGKLYKYSGIGTQISGSITGDELSIAYARERGNKGAAIIELYINGLLYDTFSTTNDTPYQENIIRTFKGTGSTIAYDLGYAFTFNHKLTINSQPINLALNISEYEDSWPSTNNAMIMRKINAANNEVHHFLVFRTPPADGDQIRITFSRGETIKPVKSTVGNIEKYINSPLESTYGDDNYHISNLKFNKGLDFRQTNPKAIKTWKFSSSNRKNFTFKIKGLAKEATGNTPEFFLNFITNHMYYFQNAGIGGFKVDDFLKNNGLRTTKQINEFQPDLLLLESCTNDDAEQSKKEEYWRAKKEGSEFIPIVQTGTYFVKLDPTATYKSIQKGDVMVLGKGDNTNLTVRIIDTWDPLNKIATFKKPLFDDDYNGNYCKIKRLDYWTNNVKTFFNKIKGKPDLMIGTSGVPNVAKRTLEGYREKGQELAKELGARFVDFYQVTYDWKYGPSQNNPVWASDDTHPKKKGIELFGKAVIKALNTSN